MQQAAHNLSLEVILETTQNKMSELLQTLNNETLALEKNDLEELQRITKVKTSLTEQIEKNEQQRIHFLTAKSFNPSEPAQWLKSDKLISIWKKIKTLSQQAQKQNLINGQVINGNRRRIQTQIEILSASAPKVELTYSSSGENVNQQQSKTLAHV
jgi:flagellar biosynthesis/type III secretory pathway chaperone